jgi:hypothetical protein
VRITIRRITIAFMSNERDKGESDATVAELTLEVLKGLRHDMRAGFEGLRGDVQSTNARLDQTNACLDQTNARLDEAIGRLDRLERRQNEGEIRVATELAAVANGVAALTELLSKKLEVSAIPLTAARKPRQLFADAFGREGTVRGLLHGETGARCAIESLHATQPSAL